MLAWYAKALPVFARGFYSLLTLWERTYDRSLQSLLPVLDYRTTRFRHSWNQITDERVHASHDLHTVGAVRSNLIKGQPKEIVPRRKWNDQSQLAIAVRKRSNFQVALSKAEQ
jgi:hypothetical protein